VSLALLQRVFDIVHAVKCLDVDGLYVDYLPYTHLLFAAKPIVACHLAALRSPPSWSRTTAHGVEQNVWLAICQKPYRQMERKVGKAMGTEDGTSMCRRCCEFDQEATLTTFN